jgi:AcrR family transcriptional regulator
VKEKIIRTSISLFEKQGFSETSIQDIVDQVGVTKGAFYYHFTSKEELLLGIHIRFIDSILRQQKQILEDKLKTCKEKLHQVVMMLIQNIESNGALARVFFRELRNLNEENLPDILRKREEFRIGIQELIEMGIANKEFRSDLRADMAAFGILGMCNWGYMWFNPDGEVKAEELASIFVDMILNGLACAERT